MSEPASPADQLAAAQRAVEEKPDSAEAWCVLGDLLRRADDFAAATGAYRRALALEPANERAAYFLAAVKGAPQPDGAPRAYVADLFDFYAPNFEAHLIGTLKYAAHSHVEWRVRQEFWDVYGALDVADLGCGTGLLGRRIRDVAKTLAGVDLSQKMIDVAREKAVYDRLVVGDLVEFLAGEEAAFDLVTAADVFAYLGDLGTVLAECRRALKPGGCLVFTVEAFTGPGYELRGSGRFAHSEEHVVAAAERAGFTRNRIEIVVGRHENQKPVDALLVSLC